MWHAGLNNLNNYDGSNQYAHRVPETGLSISVLSDINLHVFEASHRNQDDLKQALSLSIEILPRVDWLVWLGHYSGFCVSLDEEPGQLALLGESAPMPDKYSSALYGWQQCKDNTLTSCPGRWLSSQAGHMEEVWKGGTNSQEQSSSTTDGQIQMALWDWHWAGAEWNAGVGPQAVKPS
ncbi:hypothetical protein IFR05_009941 [Cadophora sp. M221]|nr:hypothetical protein IFR05_009941 [Cadophora sp. M221]